METGGGPGPDHLSDLADQPGRYHIFHALRIIEAAYADTPRLGKTTRPRQDRIRLGQQPELAFPPSTVTQVEPAQGNRPGRLRNQAFGLFGPNGPLPLHLTEYARDRLRNRRDPTFVAFADMLTHRLMSLFYRAWAEGQPAPSFDRHDDDPVARKVAALSGYHGEALTDRDAMPDVAKRHFAGLLGSVPKSADGLVSILSVFFEAPVSIRQFVASWLPLEPDDRWQLGARAGLGHATSIGDKVPSRSSKFRIHIGPLGLDAYRRLLPGGLALNRLKAIVRNYVGDVMDWDVNLILTAAEVPKPILGESVALGHTGWIGMRDPDKDADDLYLTPPRTGP